MIRFQSRFNLLYVATVLGAQRDLFHRSEIFPVIKRVLQQKIHEIGNPSLRKTTSKENHFSRSFALDDVNVGLISMKNGRASGPRTRLWLANVTASNTLPPAFKKSKIIALLKPGKPEDRPDSYRPILRLSRRYTNFYNGCCTTVQCQPDTGRKEAVTSKY